MDVPEFESTLKPRRAWEGHPSKGELTS